MRPIAAPGRRSQSSGASRPTRPSRIRSRLHEAARATTPRTTGSRSTCQDWARRRMTPTPTISAGLSSNRRRQARSTRPGTRTRRATGSPRSPTFSVRRVSAPRAVRARSLHRWCPASTGTTPTTTARPSPIATEQRRSRVTTATTPAINSPLCPRTRPPAPRASSRHTGTMPPATARAQWGDPSPTGLRTSSRPARAPRATPCSTLMDA